MTASANELTVLWNTPKQIVNDLALVLLKILPGELSMDRILFFEIMQTCSLHGNVRYSFTSPQCYHAPSIRRQSTPFVHPKEA